MQAHNHIVLSGARRKQLNGVYDLDKRVPEPLYVNRKTKLKLFAVQLGGRKRCWVVAEDTKKKNAFARSEPTTMWPQDVARGEWKEFDNKEFSVSTTMAVGVFARPIKIEGCHRQRAINGEFAFTGALFDGCPVWEKQSPKKLCIFRSMGSWHVAEAIGDQKGLLKARSSALSAVDAKDWLEFDGRVFVRSQAIKLIPQKGGDKIAHAATKKELPNAAWAITGRSSGKLEFDPELVDADLQQPSTTQNAASTSNPAIQAADPTMSQQLSKPVVAKTDEDTHNLPLPTVTDLGDNTPATKTTAKANNSTVHPPLQKKTKSKAMQKLRIALALGGLISSTKPQEQPVLTRMPSKIGQWCDPNFLPNSKSVFLPGKVANPALVVTSWRRPFEWAQHPKLFIDGVDAGDVTQGSLGDCWFISAASVVSTRPNLIRDLFVQFDGDQAMHRNGLASDGRYTVRIFKNGRWRNVTVDDRFPCGRDGLPLFGRSHDASELWVLLLEKAYAKLHGHYEALEGGTIDQGLSDLTGGLCLEFDFTHEPVLQKIKSKELWNDMVMWEKEGHLMGISLSGDGRELETPQGLFVNHAYGVLSVICKKEFHLVQIRNPWGKGEWRGAWGDTSEIWKQHPDLAEELLQNADDGKFWMSFEDMTKYFNVLHVCKLFDDNWDRQEFGGKFTAANFGGSPFHGGWSWRINPQYTITSDKPFRCLLHLQQPDSRVKEGQEHYEQSLGFAVFSLNPQNHSKTSNRMLAFGKDEIFYRHQPTLARVVSHELDFPAGTYVVLPYSLKLTSSKLEYVITFTTPTKAQVSINETDPMDFYVYQQHGEWDAKTAGGTPNEESWNNNPMPALNIPADCEVHFLLTPGTPTNHAMVLIRDEHTKPTQCIPISQSPWGLYESVMAFTTQQEEPQDVLVVPFLHEPKLTGKFELTIFSNKLLQPKEAILLPVASGTPARRMTARKSTVAAFGRVGRLGKTFRGSVRFVS